MGHVDTSSSLPKRFAQAAADLAFADATQLRPANKHRIHAVCQPDSPDTPLHRIGADADEEPPTPSTTCWSARSSRTPFTGAADVAADVSADVDADSSKCICILLPDGTAQLFDNPSLTAFDVQRLFPHHVLFETGERTPPATSLGPAPPLGGDGPDHLPRQRGQPENDTSRLLHDKRAALSDKGGALNDKIRQLFPFSPSSSRSNSPAKLKLGQTPSPLLRCLLPSLSAAAATVNEGPGSADGCAAREAPAVRGKCVPLHRKLLPTCSYHLVKLQETPCPPEDWEASLPRAGGPWEWGPVSSLCLGAGPSTPRSCQISDRSPLRLHPRATLSRGN